MKKKSVLPILILVAAPVFSAQVLDIAFSSAEGFVDDAPIDGIQGFNAQNPWVAGDVAGIGHATLPGGWSRARNYAGFTLEVGAAVVIETTFRLSTTNGWPNTDVYYVGFAEETVHSGLATPSIGSKIHSNGDGSFWVGSSDAGQQVAVPAAYSNDWIKFTQTITRSAVSNEFIGTVAATNLTAGIDLGTTSASWAQSTADGSWGGAMNPSFRGIHSGSVRMEIDHWTVSTLDAPTLPQTVVVNVDATRTRSIGGINSLDRETWFGVYHEAGYGTRELDGKTIDEWILEEGRMLPSRGTVSYDSYWEPGGYVDYTEDPNRPGYINPIELTNNIGPVSRYVTAKALDPNHKTIFSGSGHGRYPDFMCWDPADTHGINTVSNHAAHGEAVVTAHWRIQDAGGLMPHWYEVMNESSIQNNFGWFWDSDAWDKLAEFHVGVADAMHASSFSNTVKVSGPTDAYPFRDGSSGDFSSWENGNKKFIYLTEDKMDAYGIHTYEQMNGGTAYDDYLERFEIWHLGRLPSFLDLWENEQVNTWGDTKPFVFSEYGLLNNIAGDTNAFYQIRSCNGILLSLLDRPDVVDKMSAFLMSWAPYSWDQKRVFFASDDNGTNIYKTSYFEYLRFWRDLDGDYLFSNADSPHLVQHAFLDGGTNLFVVLQNNYKDAYAIDLRAALPAGASMVSAQMQRLYHANNDVARDPFTPVADLGNVLLGADETAMFKLELSGMPLLPVWDESNHYGDRTLVPMQAGVGEAYAIDLPPGTTHSAGWLNLGLYAFEGFSNGLQQVSVNGTALGNLPDLSYTAGAPRHWAKVSLRIPEGVLQEGSNSVTVVPADGEPLMKITSVRLTSEQASDAVFNADRDLDGMSDAWEIEYGFDPSDFADGALDSDGDGFDNSAEYVCGTDPHDDQDFISTIGLPETGAGFKVSFDSKSNRLYAVEATEDLQSVWIDFTNGIPGTGGPIEIIDADGTTNRFYRIKVQLDH
ncbi:hypothetical protein [Pontiella desulfatans]|nr:hypothetical protein [Pontiella desulfatans]